MERLFIRDSSLPCKALYMIMYHYTSALSVQQCTSAKSAIRSIFQKFESVSVQS